MSDTGKILGTIEAWESGALGLDEDYVVRVPTELEAQIAACAELPGPAEDENN